MNTTVSIIVPVYNGEEYLRACLSSCLDQALEGMEIICVNDGSTDRSQTIIDDLAAMHPMIRCVAKENGGLSSARNAGMRAASGEYIQFLDCDDTLRPAMLAKAYAMAQELRLDMLFFDGETVFANEDTAKHYQHYQDLYRLRKPIAGVLTGEEMLTALNRSHSYRSSACMYLVRREHLLRQGLSFFEGILYEDNPFTMQALLSSQRTAYLQETVYRRLLRENSIVSGHKDYRHARSYYLAAQLEQLCMSRQRLSAEAMKAVAYQVERLKDNARKVYMALSDEERREGERQYTDAAMIKKALWGSTDAIPMQHTAERSYYLQKVLASLTQAPYDASKPFVTVVLPVYNTEELLPETLRDLQGQTLKNFEMIFVDDGSTDASCEVIESAARNDARIRLIRQENQYAGAARNRGLDAARGEYIVFLDADDRFDENLLALAYEQAKVHDAQVVIYDADLYTMPEGRMTPAAWLCLSGKLPRDVFAGKDAAKHLFAHTNPWTKLYRRSYLTEEGFRYQTLYSSNDVYFNLLALACAKRVVALPEVLVHYRVGQSTNIQSTKDAHPMDVYEAFTALQRELKRRGLYTHYRVPFAAKAMESMLRSLDTFRTPDAYRQLYEALHDYGLEQLDIDCLTEKDMTCSNGPAKLERCRSIRTLSYNEHLMQSLSQLRNSMEQKFTPENRSVHHADVFGFMPLPKRGPFKMARKKLHTACVVLWMHGMDGVKQVIKDKLASHG